MKFIPLLLLLTLSGCAGIVIYRSVPVGSPYDLQDLEAAAGAGGIYAEIVGNPTGQPIPVFRERVRRLMSGTYNNVPVRFVGRSASNRAENYRVVVRLNPSAGWQRFNLCTYQGGVAIRPDPQRLEIAMAFCRNDTLLSESSGVFFFFKVDPATTNRFKRLVPALTAALFPERVIEEGREFESWY